MPRSNIGSHLFKYDADTRNDFGPFNGSCKVDAEAFELRDAGQPFLDLDRHQVLSQAQPISRRPH